MAFSDAKLLQQSEKYNLIRLNPARYVSDDLTLDAGTTYEMTFPFLAANKLTVDGVEYTKVTSSPSANEFTFDETTKLLQINLGASLTTQAVVAFYYLFYTTGTNRVFPQDPELAESSTNPLRDWEPKVTKPPSVGFSMENILSGTLSISSSNLTIINDNFDFNQYLTTNDSFFKKEVRFWVVINDVSNIQKQFEGEITSLNVKDNTVNLKVKNPFIKLRDTATLGDDSDEIYFKTDRFPNLDPNQEDLPIRYVVGKVSKYQTLSSGNFLENGLYELFVDPTTCFSATNVSYDENISTTTNRTHGICRVSADGFLDFSTTISAPDNSKATYTRFTVPDSTKFLVGDTFKIDRGGTPVSVEVINIDHGNNYIYTNKASTALVAGDSLEGNDCPTIIVYEESTDTRLVCRYNRDYTASTTTNAGGTTYLRVDFVNNFEANFGVSALDLSKQKIYWRVRPDQTNGGHAEVLKDLLDKAGLTTNSASFTSAQSSLDVNANFTIPFHDESDYGSYIEYAEKILASTFGYLTLNNSFELEYKLFQTPSSGSAVTDTDILENSPSIEIDYDDLIYSFIGTNPHYDSSEAKADSNNSPSVTVTSNKSRYLNEIENTFKFEHVLEKFNDVATKIAGFRAERTAKYLIDTKSINLDNNVGDDLEIIRDNILGGESSKQVKIISISKQTRRVQIITTDLEGV